MQHYGSWPLHQLPVGPPFLRCLIPSALSEHCLSPDWVHGVQASRPWHADGFIKLPAQSTPSPLPSIAELLHPPGASQWPLIDRGSWFLCTVQSAADKALLRALHRPPRKCVWVHPTVRMKRTPLPCCLVRSWKASRSAPVRPVFLQLASFRVLALPVGPRVHSEATHDRETREPHWFIL